MCITLVLSRKPGEKILIGDNVAVTIVRIGPNTVRIGIEAPKSMNIVRSELAPSDIGGESIAIISSTQEEFYIEDRGVSVE